MIIVIDNNPIILGLIKTVLEINGYHIKTFENFFSAQSFYKENQKRITAVLLDMCLTDIDYRTTIPALLLINPQVKILAMSASITLLDLPEQSKINIYGMLSKPFSIEELLIKLSKLLKHKT